MADASNAEHRQCGSRIPTYRDQSRLFANYNKSILARLELLKLLSRRIPYIQPSIAPSYPRQPSYHLATRLAPYTSRIDMDTTNSPLS